MPQPSKITLRDFVADFRAFHKGLTNKRFVWVLGAGASCQSGIPLGSELVDQWLEQMRLRQAPDAQLKSWATAQQLGIKYFTYEERANFYSQIYQHRFRYLPEEGYAYLEQLMTGKEPSPGYSILAAVLAAQPPRHNIVITTNFDNLVAQALSIYTDTAPLVVGHESLAQFVDASMRQPTVCKIHRDLFLAPKNDYRSLQRLHESWGKPLRTLFQQYTPVFIGYGGNDNTLMNLLESLEPDEINGPRPYWCYYGAYPSERITNLVSYLNGHLVPVPDFDSLMVILGLEMGIGLQDSEIDSRARQRRRRYIKRIIKLEDTNHALANEALADMRKRAGRWWAEYQKAKAEKDPEQRKNIYRKGIEKWGDSVELRCAFADFLADLGDYGHAKAMYEEALRIDPEDSNVRRNFAIFNFEVLKNADEAEKQYRLAVEFHPRDAVLINTFANFLTDIQKNDFEAEQLYRQAIQLDAHNAGIAADYASFLWHVRGSYIQADWLYRTAYQLDPKSAVVAANYAGFLLCYEQLEEAARFIALARSLNGKERNQLAAEIALYDAIVRTAQELSNTDAIEEVKNLLAAGFQRSKWNFDCVLAFAKTRLPANYPLFGALASQILNDLEANFEKWRAHETQTHHEPGDKPNSTRRED